ncbi:hypothetical protein FJTKL_14307 [Diaporthe vaccinii]|uniref:ACB domain-containing protein n=2 Tax=Diaporthe eres species complex TaxID=2972384 RepID=A0ABR4E801_9PEZI
MEGKQRIREAAAPVGLPDSRALNNLDVNLPPFPQHLEQAQRIARTPSSTPLKTAKVYPISPSHPTTKPPIMSFEKAIADSKKLTSKPSNEELLDLYALFKIANGEDISKAPAPGMFDLKGKAKKNAWQKKVDEDVTQDQAKEQYVALVEKLKAQYGYDENKEPEAVGN